MKYFYRVKITGYPEGSVQLVDSEDELADEVVLVPGWKPPGWVPTGNYAKLLGTDQFVWPTTRKMFQSRSSAKKRAALLESFGATTVIERSSEITWPQSNGHGGVGPPWTDGRSSQIAPPQAAFEDFVARNRRSIERANTKKSLKSPKLDPPVDTGTRSQDLSRRHQLRQLSELPLVKDNDVKPPINSNVDAIADGAKYAFARVTELLAQTQYQIAELEGIGRLDTQGSHDLQAKLVEAWEVLYCNTLAAVRDETTPEAQWDIDTNTYSDGRQIRTITPDPSRADLETDWEHNRCLLGDGAVAEHPRGTTCVIAPINQGRATDSTSPSSGDLLLLLRSRLEGHRIG